MNRGKNFNEYEKGVIDNLRAKGFSLRKIADNINRSHNVVANYLKKKDTHGTKKSLGQFQKLSPRQRRRICRSIQSTGQAITKIMNTNQINNVSKTTVWRVTKQGVNIEYTLGQKSPPLKPHHITARLNRVISKVSWR